MNRVSPNVNKFNSLDNNFSQTFLWTTKQRIRIYAKNLYMLYTLACGIIGLYMTRISFIRLNIFLDLANKPKCSNKWFFNVLKWKMKTNYNFFLFYWLVKSWQIESNISLQMNKRQRYLQQWMHFRDSFYFK